MMGQLHSEHESESTGSSRPDHPVCAEEATKALAEELDKSESLYRAVHRAEMEGVRNLTYAKEKARQAKLDHEEARRART